MKYPLGLIEQPEREWRTHYHYAHIRRAVETEIDAREIIKL